MAMAKWLLAALAFVSPGLAFTPEQLISAPRRGEAVPDPSGKVAIFHTSQYSFEEHATVKNAWELLDLKTGKISVLTEDPNVSEIVWLGKGSEVLYVNGTNAEVPGGVELWISDIKDFSKGYKAASLSGPLSGLKAVLTKRGDVNFVLYGQSTADGKLFNPENVEKPLSSARIYDSIFVRHWDTYLTTEFQAVFSGSLKKGHRGKYSFDGKLNNLVAPVKYAESPYPPFGGSGDYDLSPDGKTVAFMSKAPELPKANVTTSYIFVVPHDGSEVAKPINGPDSAVAKKGIVGASSAPVFSPDSKELAYIQMATFNYESDRRVIYVYSFKTGKTRTVAGNWDRSPDVLRWTHDGKTFYLSAEDRGTYKLFSLSTHAKDDDEPKPFKQFGSVSAFTILGKSDRVLVTGSAIWSSVLYYIANPRGEPKKLFFANENDPELKGLGPHDIEEFYYDGFRTKNHAWIVKPTGFSKEKKYPLAYLIHGGPQGSWANSWSTRWNPKVWADQGYVVVTPNPTGSTGFGQKFIDDIQNDWGGAPYKDLVLGWEYVRDNLDYVDVENGVAAGASYGGFMVNWIQGQPLGRKFKALVSHDGTFVSAAKIATEELFFINHDFNGTFWEARENYERFDPSAPEQILQWSTPMLVIHNDLDYRLSVAEGLALFNVLQERGVPSRFLNFPDENHWVLKPENSLVWHQQALGWINKYSGVAENNPDAIKLEDTKIPVVDIDPKSNN
ncbi:hypothetical protein VTO42DRAFT_5567 [Malbranchea cinnamomea]